MYVHICTNSCLLPCVWNGSLAEIQKKSGILNHKSNKSTGFFWDLKEIQGHVVDFLGNSRTFTYMYV